MPSWNIHTAHVESLLSDRDPRDFGIADANVFLFGNYAPDIYLGFMVPDTTFRMDYCLTHLAVPNVIPVPDADLFWNNHIFRRRPPSSEGLALALGAWAHLTADRFYNGRFRAFCKTHDVPGGDILRVRKQDDFSLFGRSQVISSYVEITPALMRAAGEYRPHSLLRADIERAVNVANTIVREASQDTSGERYQLLDAGWMHDTFAACDERLRIWLEAWWRMEECGRSVSAADMRAELGLPPATPDGTAL